MDYEVSPNFLSTVVLISETAFMWMGLGARGAGAGVAARDRRKNNEWYETAQKANYTSDHIISKG